MTDRKLRLLKRRSHRGSFFIEVGVLSAVAVTLASCSGSSKKMHPVAGISQINQVETEQATKLAESELARKEAVQKLAVALAANKTRDKELLEANTTAKRLRKDLRTADKNIADLKTELATANTQRATAEKMRSDLQQSEQLVVTLKTRLGKSGEERDLLKTQLDEAQNDNAQRMEKMVAASHEAKEAKQRIEQLDARIESVENEKSELKQQFARLQQQAAEELEKAVKESRAESERLNKQLQAALAKAASASDSGRIIHVLYRQSVKERAQVEQAAAEEAETLRDQLATTKRQIADAQAEAKTAHNEFAERIEKLISSAAAQTDTEVSGLKEKLIAANSEIIARLKAVRAEKSTSSATQQPTQPQ